MKNMRAPIGCIMGHVDAGKTLILDSIRKSKVQEGEAGGITQQIGATFLPKPRLELYCEESKDDFPKMEFHLPGILMIDTPGHEAFHNMRARGSSLCDIAILAVDINDARREELQPQAIESLKMLQGEHVKNRTPFVIAMNKVDLVYGWKTPTDEKGNPIGGSFSKSYELQSDETKNYLQDYIDKLKVHFAKLGFNTEIFTENKKKKTDISIVPCSAITGEGIPDLMCLIAELTQKYMAKGLQFVSDQVKAAVLEVKKVEGIGNVMDVILANGELRLDDEIVLNGIDGPIHTPVKALLLPHASQEMRVKGQYMRVDKVTAAAGVRILGRKNTETGKSELVKAMAGSAIFVVPRNIKKLDQKRDAIDELKDQVCADFSSMIHEYQDPSGVGVHVQANTLGAMEALLEYICKEMKVPVKSLRLGAISKRDIMGAAVMNDKARPEYACILSFMVDMDPSLEELAAQQKVQIFRSDIIYHLKEMFEDYLAEVKERRRRENTAVAIFPVKMEILKDHIIRKANPLILGCRILQGTLRKETPICSMKVSPQGLAVPFHLGVVDGIQLEQKDREVAEVGEIVAVRIQPDGQNVLYGRHFDHTDHLVSELTRQSLDKFKDLYIDDFRDDKEMIKLCIELKKYFGIL